MSASRGGGSRLSRKRKYEDSTQPEPSNALHDITDDFEDLSTVFRVPKKSKIEKLIAPVRPRGRPKRSGVESTSANKVKNKLSIDEDDDDAFSNAALGNATTDKDSEDVVVLDDGFALDESFLCKDEKLCGSCKHIVPAAIYGDHLKECLQKFRLSKRDTRSLSHTSGPSLSGNLGNEKPKVKDTASVQEKENVQVLPCPVCLKPLKSKIGRQSHIKSCGQSRGLSSEKLVLAVRLQEKQAEERNLLGLPVVTAQPSAVQPDKENGRPKRRGTGAGSSKDPDLAMAIALSRSFAEEEAEKRASQEEKLLALGLDQIVEDDRKTKPVVVLSFPKGAQKTAKAKQKGRGSRGCKNLRNSVLATRSTGERERIISEKVASILTAEATPNANWEEKSSPGGCRRLSRFRDENSDSGSDEEEESVVDSYCTQLALAELLGSQELNTTHAHSSRMSLDLTSVQDFEEASDPGPNVTLEAASGFWLVHPNETKETNLVGGQKQDDEEGADANSDTNREALREIGTEKSQSVENRSNNSVELEETNKILSEDTEWTTEQLNASNIVKNRNLEEHSAHVEVEDGEEKLLGRTGNDNVADVSETDICNGELHSRNDIEYLRTSHSRVNTNDCSSETSRIGRTLVKDKTCGGESGNESVAYKGLTGSQKLCGQTLPTVRLDNSDNLDTEREKESPQDTTDKAEEGLSKDFSRLSERNGIVNCTQKVVPVNQTVKVNTFEIEDSEILCVLDTSMEEPPQKKHSSTSSEVQRCHKKLSRLSQRKSHSPRKQEEGDGRLSRNSSDSDKTELFDDAEGNDLQDLDDIDSAFQTSFTEMEDLVGKDLSQRNKPEIQEKVNHGKSSQSDVRNEDLRIVDNRDSLHPTRRENSAIDSESDEEGGAKTIIYHDLTPDRMSLSPAKGSCDGRIDMAEDLDKTVPFEDQVCDGNDAPSSALKNLSVMEKDCGSLPVQKDENDTLIYENAIDLDETKLYNDADKLLDKNQCEAESQSAVIKNVRVFRSSGPGQGDKDLQETLPYENCSKMGDTAIHQILAAFEETIPHESVSKMNDTVLYDNGNEAQETVAYESISKLENTLPHEMVNDLEKTLPYEDGIDGDETILHKDSIPEVFVLQPKAGPDEVEKTVADNDSCVLEGNVTPTVAERVSVLEGNVTPTVAERVSVLEGNVTPTVAERVNDTKGKSSSKIQSSNSGIQKNIIVNISPRQRRSSDSAAVDEESDSMHARLIYDWGSLLASGEESDVRITAIDGQDLSAHSIVLLVRCPELYAEVKKAKSHITWSEVSYEGAYVFLVYLYTGACSIKTKDDSLWMDVFDLALKYNCEELVGHLESLYKLGNSPMKSTKSVHRDSEPEFGVPSLLLRKTDIANTESEEVRTIIATKSILVPVQTSTSTAVKGSLLPVQTSPAVKGSIMPAQSSTQVKASTSDVSSHSSFMTPKAGKATGIGKEKIVRRCLDLSPINKTALLKVNDTVEIFQREDIDARILHSTHNASKRIERPFLYLPSSQSPDLFDSTVSMDNVSYITTPPKSPLTIPSPQSSTVTSCTKEPQTDQSVTNVRMIDTTPPGPCSPERLQDMSSSANLQCQVRSNSGREGEQYHCNDVEHHIDESHHSDAREAGVEGYAKLSHMEEGNQEKEEDGNVIDLTNDSSDNSMSSFCPVESDVTRARSDNYANTDTTSSIEDMEPLQLPSTSIEDMEPLQLPSTSIEDMEPLQLPSTSTEDMEPLQLADSEESVKENVITTQEKENFEDKSVDVESGTEMAIDITCPSPKSVVSVQEDGENDGYISNVWDDFDDVGCGIPIDSPVTPAKKANVKGNDDADSPSVEKIDKRTSDSAEIHPIVLNVSGASSKSCSSMSNFELSSEFRDRRTSGTPDKGTGFQQPSPCRSACEKAISGASSGASTVSDATMLKLRNDFDDSSLWREEFEPVFAVAEEEDTFQTTSNKDKPNQKNQLKTPRQKTTARKTVTPMPNYKQMPSPDLKRELKLYGIKPISRNKAVTILEHVYEKTHPLVTDSEADSSYCETPQRPQSSKPTVRADKETSSALHKRAVAQNQRKAAKNVEKEPKKSAPLRKVPKATTSKSSTVQVVDEDDEDDESPLNLSQTSSISTDGSERDCFEESMALGIGDEDHAITATQQGDLASQVTQFITSDPEFHLKVLLYEPFFVEDLQASLKANGVKCNMKNILDILDNQCITFRTHQGQRSRQRKRKCKRKSGGTPGKSPPKSKRGRS